MSHSIDSLTDAKNALRDAETALAHAVDSETTLLEAQQHRIAELAHEIRTPLNAVIGYAQMISQETLGKVGDPAYKEYANTIHQAGMHLMEVCDTLLEEFLNTPDVSEMPTEETDARQMIAGVINLFSWMAKERGVTLDSEIDANFPLLKTNARRLNQVLINLVSNAIKFTPRGGKVGINGRVNAKSGAMILVVQDNGTGISELDLLKIRSPFVQGSTASPHGDQGTGLGLSIANRLVEEMGGQLDVASQEGAGTIVTITLPTAGDPKLADKVKAKLNLLP